MCGIIGIFGENNPKERAHQSLEKIVHRGSNTFELAYFPNAVLGANRLPIVDREHAVQPQSNENGTIFATQNGEIFNYKKLKEELIDKGHQFKTDSDTEVLVHLYEEYGTEMVYKLDTEMFAFIVFDRNDNSVFVARDPLGVKPLYYAEDKSGQFYFASELKQLSFFEDIEEIYTFPAGTYFFNGEFKKYFTLQITNELNNEKEIIDLFEKKIVEAVSKRVQTDLPIGVFLSGGVDSSLIMEIATRIHPDVTAIILGYPGSSDYEYALRLCQDRKYKHHIVRPDVDFEKELDGLIYHLETYEPLIIRQSFSLDICAREANRLGLKVVLVGEGADELFGGYNEFSNLPAEKVNQGCLMLTESLSAGHLQRVDRMSMKHTVEIRAPFFDKEVVEVALKISGELKIKKENHQVTTKYILRKTAANFLPDYIAWRYKVPFSNGAGMNVGNNFKSQDGDVAKIILEKEEAQLAQAMLDKYTVSTKEGKYYLKKFDEFGFTKLLGSEKRLVVKDNLNDLHSSQKQRLLVGEFDRLALYFPVYFAAQKGIFVLHDLDIDFIATGGDDKTYGSLVNNSAHIGLSDPMFAMFENKEGVKGEIVGELVENIPGVAITLNPNVKIKKIEDFKKYKVGTFEAFSTMNGIVKYLLPKETSISDFEHKTLLEKLASREIDVAVVLPEQAYELELIGGRIVFDFSLQFQKFLFSGFTISNILEEKYREHLKSFVVAVREAVQYIRKNKKEALAEFARTFPELKASEKIFDCYLNLWSTTLKVEKEDYKNACDVWKENYPQLLKKYVPYFRKVSIVDPVIEKINSREYRRDFPFLEDVLEKNIIKSLNNKTPLEFVGFWGAGEKEAIDNHDKNALRYFKSYIENIKSVFAPEIKITWILSDAHAKNNGYAEEKYTKYLEQIKVALEEAGFQVIYLSQLWEKWNLKEQDIQESLEKQEKNWWSKVAIAAQLEKQAQKRFKMDDFVFGAQKYYIMRKLEKPHLEKEFKDCVFFSFNDGQTQSLLPKLPSIYLYSENRGISDVPWFNN